MIEETSGDLLSAEVEALVNAVNTVGVMGKGGIGANRAGSTTFEQGWST